MDEARLKAVGRHLSASWRRDYTRRLTRWYDRHQRTLPWRQTRDPYAIWISETMLQQTQVATVVDYYLRFVVRFPDVFALADADEQTVLGLWAGLGYYRRARQLHAAAKKIVTEYDGNFPTEVSQLIELPGIGRYTAGAIASIAYDLPAPILEANTQRLYARLIGLKQSLQIPSVNAILWDFAQWQLPSGQGGGSRKLNQAAMELGSLVCKPVEPQCDACPLHALCPTAEQGLQTLIPAPKPKKVIDPLHHLALLIVSNHRWLVRQNPLGGWWVGLWDFPRVDITDLGLPSDQVLNRALGKKSLRQKIEEVAKKQLELPITIDQHFWTMKHSVTRYRITLECLHAKWSSPTATEPLAAFEKNGEQTKAEWRWVAFEELQALPLTASARRISKRLP